MTKLQFIKEMRSALSDLPKKEVEDALAYCAEMIDDRVEGGMNEESAVAALGTPSVLAREMMLDMPLSAIIKKKCRKKLPRKVSGIVMLALSSPLWLPLLVSAFALFVGVYALLWGCVIYLWACDFVLGVLSVGSLIVTIPNFVSVGFSSGILYIGSAFAFAGASVLFFFVCRFVTVFFFKVSLRFLRYTKSLIIGKEKRRA